MILTLSVDHNAAIHSKGPLEVEEPDIPEAGDPVLPTNERSTSQQQ